MEKINDINQNPPNIYKEMFLKMFAKAYSLGFIPPEPEVAIGKDDNGKQILRILDWGNWGTDEDECNFVEFLNTINYITKIKFKFETEISSDENLLESE